MINWSYDLHTYFSIHFLCYIHMLLRLRSVGLHGGGLTDLEQPQLCDDLIEVDFPACENAQERKYAI